MTWLKRYPLLIFYAVTFLFSGGCEILYVIYGTSNPFFSIISLLFASYGPTLGVIVTLTFRPDLEERQTLRQRLFKWRVNWRWYLAGGLLPALAWLSGTALTSCFGGSFPFHPALFATIPFLLLANLGEEIGWRGFALPRLLARYNSLNASLLLGAMWSLMHLPLYFQAPLTFVPFSFLMVALSIIMTWVFNHTESLPIMVLMHTSLDTVTNFVAPPGETGSVTLTFVFGALVMWLLVLTILLRTGPGLGQTNLPEAKSITPGLSQGKGLVS